MLSLEPGSRHVSSFLIVIVRVSSVTEKCISVLAESHYNKTIDVAVFNCYRLGACTEVIP